MARLYRYQDYPQTTALLSETMPTHVFQASWIEYAETGMRIDWDGLIEHSPISSTEEAVVHIARGVSMFERHGQGHLWSKTLHAMTQEVSK